MVYQGSKDKISKYLIPIIQDYIEKNNIDTYIELMVGGCNLIDKVQCEKKIGCDINNDLITLLKYIQKDNEVSIAPLDCSFDHYKDVRVNKYNGKYPLEYVALIGYCASYGGRYFDGGYATAGKSSQRNIYQERVKNLRKQAPLLNDIEFYCCDYFNFDFSKYKNALFYFDPPYKGTKQYSKDIFDYDKFYDFCRDLSKTNIALISEYDMPDDFKCIWKKEVKVNQKSNRTTADKAIEKLFIKENIL